MTWKLRFIEYYRFRLAKAKHKNLISRKLTKVSVQLSSIITMLSGQFLIFIRKILQHKKRKSNFYSLKSFCAQKNFAFCCFLFVYFCFVGWFLLVLRFLRCRIFLKKIRNYPDNLIYYTIDVYPYQPPYWEVFFY